jgi:hypothetical protein
MISSSAANATNLGVIRPGIVGGDDGNEGKIKHVGLEASDSAIDSGAGNEDSNDSLSEFPDDVNPPLTGGPEIFFGSGRGSEGRLVHHDFRQSL